MNPPDPRQPIVAFTLGQLSKRLGIDAAVLRLRIADGTIACHMQPPGRPQPWAPVISRDAAAEFCLLIGLDPMRVMR